MNFTFLRFLSSVIHTSNEKHGNDPECIRVEKTHTAKWKDNPMEFSEGYQFLQISKKSITFDEIIPFLIESIDNFTENILQKQTIRMIIQGQFNRFTSCLSSRSKIIGNGYFLEYCQRLFRKEFNCSRRRSWSCSNSCRVCSVKSILVFWISIFPSYQRRTARIYFNRMGK